MLYTNLKLLRADNACSSGLQTLINSLPKKHSDTKLIPLSHILKSNGLEHGLWALRATSKDGRVIAARMAIEFARQSLSNFEKQFPEDKRPRAALQAATDFLDGKITLEEFEWAARSATKWAARSARSSASAARSAEWAVRSSASAARSAEWAVRSAEWAVRSAGEWAVRSAGEWAARSSARSPEWAAARSAEWAVRSAAEWSASAARSAARSSARSAEWAVRSAAEWSAIKKQGKIVLKILSAKAPKK